MRIGPQQRPVFVFWCWLYIVLGISCLLAGLFMLLAPSLLGTPADTGMRMIGIVCVVFGLARIGNSILVLRQLRQRRP